MIHVYPRLRRRIRSVLNIQPIEMSGTRRQLTVVVVVVVVFVAMVIFVSLITIIVFFLLHSLRQENNLSRIVLLCILFRALVNINQLSSQQRMSAKMDEKIDKIRDQGETPQPPLPPPLLTVYPAWPFLGTVLRGTGCAISDDPVGRSSRSTVLFNRRRAGNVRGCPFWSCAQSTNDNCVCMCMLSLTECVLAGVC
jgi:hypothetical protein